MAEIDLDALVERLAGEPVGETELVASWTALAERLGLDPERGKETVLATARDATHLATGQLDPAFGGGWQWDLSDATVRAIVTSTLLAGVLASAGVTAGLVPLVVPAVLPFLFELKRVRLVRSAERVIKIFGARPTAFDRTGSPATLYASLPQEVRDVVSLEELTEFLEEAVRAGQAEEEEGVFEVLPNGETVLRLTIR